MLGRVCPQGVKKAPTTGASRDADTLKHLQQQVCVVGLIIAGLASPSAPLEVLVNKSCLILCSIGSQRVKRSADFNMAGSAC